MPELLLEVGVEELPAAFVRKAYTDLAENLRRALGEAGLLPETATITSMGTPRRLIVGVSEIRHRQPDETKEQRGPGVKAAYDADGKPTQALLGFCRAQGADPNNLRNDGQYVWITKHIEGRPANEILAELLPKAIRALTFDKTMRWGAARMRFARPIRWILASLGGQVVPFDIEGVQSGLQSRGHRFYAPDTFEATSLAQLVTDLRSRKVEPDPEVRRERIVEQTKQVAGGTPYMTDALIDENVFLTEWPTAIVGAYKEEFAELPEPVLITAMAKHEKMFPVRDAGGRLTTAFVFIRNSGEDETVRKGAAWVLNARFNDAKFFFDEDKKHSLQEFLDKTSGILFQEKLGSVRQRAERLAALAVQIAERTGADQQDQEAARLAGLYAKADLSTGLVSELASLQGIIGGEYARREGLPIEVCQAIAAQYDHAKITEANTPSGRTAIRLIMADQLDKLAGYLGQGLTPSGSSDPYGLRRAATILIEVAWLWHTPLPGYDELLRLALANYTDVELDEAKALSAFADLMATRYEAMLPEARYDLLDAALRARTPQDVGSPRQVKFRLRALERVADDIPFIQTATRPLNIVSAAAKKNIPFGDSHAEAQNVQSQDGEALLSAREHQESPVLHAVANEDDELLVRSLLTLAEPINRFFDSTMVMAEDEQVRFSRLTLLNLVSQQLIQAGDWSKIVIEG
jgi:glycyl-tRNA synthetase beta chain